MRQQAYKTAHSVNEIFPYSHELARLHIILMQAHYSASHLKVKTRFGNIRKHLPNAAETLVKIKLNQGQKPNAAVIAE